MKVRMNRYLLERKEREEVLGHLDKLSRWLTLGPFPAEDGRLRPLRGSVPGTQPARHQARGGKVCAIDKIRFNTCRSSAKILSV